MNRWTYSASADGLITGRVSGTPPAVIPVLVTFLITGTGLLPATLGPTVAAQQAAPVAIGSQAAGTFSDATGHSAQSHLIYAANSGVWWLFTLTSAADSQGGSNHVIKSFRSSGSNLATATWAPGPDSPGASVSAGFAPNGYMGTGRALGVAYLNNSPTDVVHAELNMAYNGQDGITGHIRAVLTGTSLTWASWNYYVAANASVWAAPKMSALGVSSGKYIHSAGPNLQQEIDANARRSNTPDTGSAWTSGFSGVSVIDNSMIHEVNAFAFAPLANEVMLAVYDNGGGQSCGYNCVPAGSPSEPNLNNLGYKRSNANGSWPGVPIGGQGPGDGSVFGTTAIVNQNDWALVPLTTSVIHAFRAKANGSGADGATYNAATNIWSGIAVPPPAFGAGQAFKSGGGLFGATDGTNVWLFCVSTGAANAILYSRYNGSAWSAWAAVPGTDSGTHVRSYLSGYPRVGSNQIGLIWMEGTSPYNVLTTSLAVSTTPRPGPPGDPRIIR